MKKDKMKIVRQSHELILSRDIDDQTIPQSDQMWDTTGHTQPKVLVLSNRTFP